MCFGSQLIYQFSVLPCFVQLIDTIRQIQTYIFRRTFCYTLTFFMELQCENHCHVCHIIFTLKAIEDSSRGLADKWVFVQLRRANMGCFLMDFSWQCVLLCPSAEPYVWKCTAPFALRAGAIKLQGFVTNDVFSNAL